MKMVVSMMQTNEPNGVKIQIPVHNAAEFAQKAHDFYRFWLPGRVLLNGQPPVWEVGEKIDDNLYYYPKSGASYVVMGNVPYKIANPDALFPKGMNRISFVAYVPVGAVEFTPAREALKYSDHTKNSLQTIITDFIVKSVDLAKKEIAAATTHYEAYKLWSKWKNVIGSGQVDDLEFKGEPLVERFPLLAYHYNLNAYRGGGYTIREFYVSQTNSAIFVTDFTPSVNASHKRKVKSWLAHTGRSADVAVFTSATTLNSPWIDPSRIVTWEQIKKEAPKPPKKPRAINTAPGRLAGTFDLITQAGRETEKDVPSAKPLYYIMVQEYNTSQDLDYTLQLFDYDTSVVLLPANRKDKFLRHYPHAVEILQELRSKVTFDGESLISKEGKEYLSLNWTERETLAKMDDSRVDDPELKRLIGICKNRDSYLKEYNKHQQLANVLGEGFKFKRHRWDRSFDCKACPMTDVYPLASNFGRGDTKRINEHVYYYMNAVYAARKAGKIV
jgi:hypothetical protein